MAPDTTPDAPIATEAAAAHAEELGVDLSTVEGTGKDGTIKKADVAAAAAAQQDAPTGLETVLAEIRKIGDRVSSLEGKPVPASAAPAPAQAAAAESGAPTRPAVGTPELESVIDSVVALADNELGLVHEALEKELYQRRTQVAT
jgi:pyruvate/2-oxoglutarate dehydrogenase complex dihydrolipoamide acyltransferase (E2) component